MGKPFQVTDATFSKEVLQASTPTLVDFWAEWCLPCRRVAPVVEAAAAEHDGQLRLAKLDVDGNPQTPTRYRVYSIPTLILFKGGEEVARIVGFRDKDALLDVIEPHLG
ncbi:MAG: thioredoxin [Anaerolineae bacterium]|nr:thioredoxin [Anaerolineae bacterium]